MIDQKAFYNLSYGLFVLTAKDKTDNGCIINTCQLLTDNPKVITIAVNKNNYTHEQICKTNEFNVSILTKETPFKVFEHFGFQSGRKTNKFAELEKEERSNNGILIIPSYTNAYLSAKVIGKYDYNTHTLFVAEVTEAKVLSDKESLTYDYYQKNIKPQPKKTKGYVCTVCGYVYEGETLPSDFVCPLCNHDASFFEPIE